MFAICLLILKFAYLISTASCMKYDIEDTICSLCEQRKVCKPEPPFQQGQTVAFSASMTKTITVNPGDKIIMDYIVTNLGGYYEGENGTFVCLDNGNYFFSWNILKVKGNSFSVLLVVDGIVKSSSYGDGSTEDAISSTVVLTLQKGDKVWLQGGHQSALVRHHPYSMFSGMKI